MRETQHLQLIEPVPIDDDLCTGLAMIEDLGFGCRFVFYSQQTCFEGGGPVCVVKRKIVLPGEAAWPGVEMTISFLAARMRAIGDRRVLRLVR